MGEYNWLVVWNIFFHILGIIIPIDFHMFQRVETTNQTTLRNLLRCSIQIYGRCSGVVSSVYLCWVPPRLGCITTANGRTCQPAGVQFAGQVQSSAKMTDCDLLESERTALFTSQNWMEWSFWGGEQVYKIGVIRSWPCQLPDYLIQPDSLITLGMSC